MIKRRNMLMQVLLMIITLGIYGIYWFYVTSKEMIEHKGLNGNAVLWLVLTFVPFLNFYAYYKHGEALAALTDGSINKWLMLVLWICVQSGHVVHYAGRAEQARHRADVRLKGIVGVNWGRIGLGSPPGH